MQFVRDDIADEIVNKDRRLQDHVHARSVILWLPGMSSGIAVQVCLMFAGAGIAISLLWLGPMDVERFKYFVIGVALGAVPMSLLFNALVRGVPSARVNMFRLSVVHSCIAAVELLSFLLLGRSVSAAIAAAGLVFSLAAVRFVAGPSYALLAAIYRAQRVRFRR